MEYYILERIDNQSHRKVEKSFVKAQNINALRKSMAKSKSMSREDVYNIYKVNVGGEDPRYIGSMWWILGDTRSRMLMYRFGQSNSNRDSAVVDPNTGRLKE